MSYNLGETAIRHLAVEIGARLPRVQGTHPRVVYDKICTEHTTVRSQEPWRAQRQASENLEDQDVPAILAR
eukprot:10711342-Ditylum_brightwellii.AAC.1